MPVGLECAVNTMNTELILSFSIYVNSPRETGINEWVHWVCYCIGYFQSERLQQCQQLLLQLRTCQYSLSNIYLLKVFYSLVKMCIEPKCVNLSKLNAREGFCPNFHSFQQGQDKLQCLLAALYFRFGCKLTVCPAILCFFLSMTNSNSRFARYLAC